MTLPKLPHPFNKITLIVLLFCSALIPGNSQDTLKILISGSPPFVMEDSTDPQGISIEVWEKVAELHDLNYKYFWNPNVDEALRQVKNGEVDVVVGPISITSERAEHVRFTQPYFIASYSIASSHRGLSIWSRIRPFFSKGFFIAISVLLLTLTGVGALLWLAERKDNSEQFPPDPVNGIGNGIWLAVVTMTTVGYGDRAPITKAGRIIAGSWMIIALVTATSLVAGIASTLTVSGLSTSTIQGPDDLSGNKVAVVGNSPAKEFVEDHAGTIVESNDLETSLQKLKEGEVKAVIYDRPQLKYYLEKHPNQARDLSIGLGEYLPQGYGFVTPLDSPWSKTLSVYLLGMQEEGIIRGIVQDWLGKDEAK